MCLAAIALDAHPRWRLVIAANRDEFHERPADPLARWSDGSGIIAGRDRTGGGTWLGLTEAGRLALLTNRRVETALPPGRPSRGQLVCDLLSGQAPEALDLAAYNPMNLLLLGGGAASFVTNHPAPAITPLPAGLHGLSNGPLDPPWTKTSRTMAALADWLDEGRDTDLDPLFAALNDRTPTESVPRPGAPEPRFSSAFIVDPVYGTRCSTLVTVDRAGRGRIAERRFDAAGEATGETALEFTWPV